MAIGAATAPADDAVGLGGSSSDASIGLDDGVEMPALRGVGLAVTTGLAVEVGAFAAPAFGVGVGLDVGGCVGAIGVGAVGFGVGGFGVGAGVGVDAGGAVGFGVGFGVGVGVGVGFGVGFGEGVGVGVGLGVGVGAVTAIGG